MKKNRFVILFSLLMIMSSLMAQVTIRVQAPSEVIQGDRFRIAYIVNTSDVDDFRIGFCSLKEDRILDTVNVLDKCDPKAVLDSLQKAVARFSAGEPQFDDLTMVCLEFRG